tara:strand:- start:70 stop:867 length:798 start_codon:yes stop_codon:yes gene_type:complete
MKIAVCLHGYFGTVSTGDMNTGYNSEKKIKKFLGDRDVDYFIHCWQPELEDTLQEMYSPKKLICEEQKDFLPIMEEHNLDQDWFDEGFNRNATMYVNAVIWRSLSSLYTRSKALELLEGEYDRVFTMRLDIGNRGPDSVNFPHRFDFDSDEKYMYSVYWEQLNHGLGDMWFVCNQKDAEIMATVYDKALEYYKKDSDYVKAMLEGWPDSEWYPHETPDPREFSNIVLSKRKTDLMKYPKWYCVNTHTLYKYFFIDTNIYSRTKYI